MRTIGSAVLVFEWIVFALAVPVAINVGGVDPKSALVLLGAVTVLIVVAVAKLPGRTGIALGWGVQLVALASGLVVIAMAILGAMFTGLWFMAVRLGTEADARAIDQRSKSPAPAAESEHKEPSS